MILLFLICLFNCSFQLTRAIVFPCPSDWISYNNSVCFQFNHNKNTTFLDAAMDCNRQNSYLASVHSYAENTFLRNTLNLFKIQSEGIWLGLYRSDYGQFEWHDRSSLRYTHWDIGEPKTGFLEKCVEMHSRTGFWSDIQCSDYRGYVCEKPRPTYLLPLPSFWPCPLDWIPYSSKCYKYCNNPRTYTSATIDCHRQKGSLVSVHSMAENTFLKTLVPSSSVITIWLGVHRSTPVTQFEWQDKSVSQFSNWYPGEKQLDFKCVVMHTWNGRWSAAHCSNKAEYVCEKPKAPELILTTRPQQPQSSIPTRDQSTSSFPSKESTTIPTSIHQPSTIVTPGASDMTLRHSAKASKPTIITQPSTDITSRPTTITSGATKITPVSTITNPKATKTPEATTTTPPATDITPVSKTTTPPETDITPVSTTTTPPATDITPVSTTTTPPATDITPVSTTTTPPATKITPESTTTTPPATEITPVSTTTTPGTAEITPVSTAPTTSIPGASKILSTPTTGRSPVATNKSLVTIPQLSNYLGSNMSNELPQGIKETKTFTGLSSGGLIGIIIGIIIALAIPTVVLIVWKKRVAIDKTGSSGFKSSSYQYDTFHQSGSFVPYTTLSES